MELGGTDSRVSPNVATERLIGTPKFQFCYEKCVVQNTNQYSVFSYYKHCKTVDIK